MTSFVFDFKDINSRMKGDLLPRREPAKLCPRCEGKGRYIAEKWNGALIYENCSDCTPEIPRLCLCCKGLGMSFDGRICTRCIGSGKEP